MRLDEIASVPQTLDIHGAMHDNGTFVAQEPRDHQLTIRIPQRIRDAIGAQAEAERRTVADVVNNLLEERYPPVPPREKARR
jgi:hypothetical protein